MAAVSGKSDCDGVEESLHQDGGGSGVQGGSAFAEPEELDALVEQVGLSGVEVLVSGFVPVGHGGVAAADEPADLIPAAHRQDKAVTELVEASSGASHSTEAGGEDLFIAQGYPSEPTSLRQGGSRQGRLARGRSKLGGWPRFPGGAGRAGFGFGAELRW